MNYTISSDDIVLYPGDLNLRLRELVADRKYTLMNTHEDACRTAAMNFSRDTYGYRTQTLEEVLVTDYGIRTSLTLEMKEILAGLDVNKEIMRKLYVINATPLENQKVKGFPELEPGSSPIEIDGGVLVALLEAAPQKLTDKLTFADIKRRAILNLISEANK